MDETKEIVISGCIEVPSELTLDEVNDIFLTFIEINGWSFGGTIKPYVEGEDDE